MLTSQQAAVETLNISGGEINPGSGMIAQRLMQNDFSVQSLRTFDLLKKDEWIKYDTEVTKIAGERLVAIGDLVSRGLVFGLDNPLGHTKVEFQNVSNLRDAIVSMSGISQGQADLLDFNLESLPIPIVHKDFQLDLRHLSASRNGGMALDTTQAEVAARIVTEKNESILFNGTTVKGSSGQIYGYTNAPDRGTGSTTADWNTATGEQILNDLLAMISTLETKKMYGPYMVYVSTAAGVHLSDDYKANSDKTIIQRLREVANIIDIKPTAQLTDGEVVVVQMTKDVVDIIDGLQPTVLQWESHGGMMINFKVMSILVPRVRSDYEGKSGIVHYT